MPLDAIYPSTVASILAEKNNILNQIGFLLCVYYWVRELYCSHAQVACKSLHLTFRNLIVRNITGVQVTAPLFWSANSPEYSAAIPLLYYKWAPYRLLCPSPTSPHSAPPVPPPISSSSSEVSPKKMTHLWCDIKEKNIDVTHLQGLHLSYCSI